jgi:hypothetical protein
MVRKKGFNSILTQKVKEREIKLKCTERKGGRSFKYWVN